MPLHRYIEEIYRISDPLYFIRFIDYLLTDKKKRFGCKFSINRITAKVLISGILQNIKTGELYYSLNDLYNKAFNENKIVKDVEIFNKIKITDDYTLMRILCSITEDDILDFYDQKYRALLIHRDIKKQITDKTGIYNIDKNITIEWCDKTYIISVVRINCEDSSSNNSYDFMEEYEKGCIDELYYIDKNTDTRYLISNN